MKIIQSLNEGWNLTIVPNETLRRDHFNPKTIDEILNSPYETVSATVPGNFELDLWRAGKIADPFYSINMLDLQKLENRHLFYTLKFDAPNASEFPAEDVFDPYSRELIRSQKFISTAFISGSRRICFSPTNFPVPI